MLEICHSFYKCTDIKANIKKYEVIKINSNEKTITINEDKIEKINNKNKNRFLDIFFTHNYNRRVHINKIQNMIDGFI